jgi:hypothetical protein
MKRTTTITDLIDHAGYHAGFTWTGVEPPMREQLWQMPDYQCLQVALRYSKQKKRLSTVWWDAFAAGRRERQTMDKDREARRLERAAKESA